MKRIILTSLTILLLSCAKNNSNMPMRDYNDVKHIDFTHIFTITDDSFYLYYYSPRCSYCKKIKENIITFASVHNVYFVNVENVRSNCFFNDFSYLELDCFKGTPTLRYIYLGEIMMSLEGEKEVNTFLFT